MKSHKRRNSPIRRRCLEFLEILKEYGYTYEIPLEEAKRLFFVEMGIGDPKSLKAYFGSRGCKSIKRMQRIARYSTGAISFKNIELMQEIPERQGYFEMLGLATFEFRGNKWFMILKPPRLVPQLGKGWANYFMDKISLSSCGEAEEKNSAGEGLENHSLHEQNKQTTTYRGRERNFQRKTYTKLYTKEEAQSYG